MKPLIFDNSPLSAFARAGALPILEKLSSAWPRRLVTQAVLGELARAPDASAELLAVADLLWLEAVPLDDSLNGIAILAHYTRVLGSGVDEVFPRDVGEATTLACAELQGGIAVLDEQAGRRAGTERGVEVHGSLWLIARGIRQSVVTDVLATDLVDRLRASGARFPCSGSEFLAWARVQSLL